MRHRCTHVLADVAVNNEVLALILGGGQGTRLFPLTQLRSKPAVPIGGKYRLIDIPDQQLPARRHPADLRADAVQLGVAQPAHLADLPDGSVQPGVRRDPRGRADARQPELVPGHGRRRAAGGAPLRPLRRRLLPDPRRRSPVPHGLRRAGRRAHRSAAPTSPSPRSRSTLDDASAMGIFRFDRSGQIVAFEEKPNARAAGRDRPEHSAGRDLRRPQRRTSRSSRRWASTSSRATCCSTCSATAARQGLRPRGHPGGARPLPRERVPVPRLLGRRRHRRVVLRRQHHADAAAARRSGSTIRTGRSTRTRGSCPARASATARSRDAIVAEGCYLDRCTVEESVVGIRTHVQAGATIRRSVLLGADFYEADDEAPARGDAPRLGIGRDVVLDRVIVDKNARIGDGARLVNERGRRARRRRRLLHPQRHHHRAEGRRDPAEPSRSEQAAWPAPGPAARQAWPIELVEGIDERVRPGAVDADDAVQPGRHRHRLDDERDQAALAVAHVEHLAR